MSFKQEVEPIFTAIAVIALLIAVIAGWLAGGPYTKALPKYFNSDVWKTADTWDTSRCAMIADLQYRVGIDGKTRSELVELLGEPRDRYDGPEWGYWELCLSFMDVWILEVRWDGDRATSATVRDT